ncbi:putative transmembrane protein [Melioribacter roseus P3M-2]|uniref:Putative transmembrane protein n=1 Tax=Melioribacter roseus (strain DSM 23840 / JCM 17771 / VKM B-2668 / P3M-2) TaxID=1191523 RepID=I6ZR17_MELRP|nr:lysylphosphatidylglycerol synthase transmembrane domain-containing protein [Melioribacter roseus]AFN74504.1 putative transmembrane protein [Melioribacter roseus P3M-2]
MNNKIHSAFFIGGLIIFVILVYNFGVNEIIENIYKTGVWFLPIVGIWGFVYLINTCAWFIIIDGFNSPLKFSKIFSITLSGFAINYITPVASMGGEPYRIYALKNFIGLDKSVSSTILYTMIHYTSHFLFWLTAIALLAIYSPLSFTLTVILIALAAVLILLILFFISRHKKGVLVSLYRLLGKISFFNKYFGEKYFKEDSIIKIDKEITSFYNKRKKAFYLSLILDYLGRIVASIEFLFILKSIGADISFFDAIFISAASSLIMNIIFFVPMELGIREGSLMLVMNALKYGSGIGVYIGLVNRIREFFWILVGLLLIQFNKYGIKKGNIMEDLL